MAELTDPRTLPGWDHLNKDRQIDVLVEWAVYERRIVSLRWPFLYTPYPEVGILAGDSEEDDFAGYANDLQNVRREPATPGQFYPSPLVYHHTNWDGLPALVERMAQKRWTWYSITPEFCEFVRPSMGEEPLGVATARHTNPLVAVCLAALRALGVEA